MNLKPPELGPSCPWCGGTGWKDIGAAGERCVARCDCFLERRAVQLLRYANIPPVHEKSDFSNYNVESNSSLQKAKLTLQRWASEYPLDKTGLLLIGPSGVGKTHLSIAVVKELTGKGVNSLFYDYRELLKRIQNSYNPSVETTELEVLRPVFDCEVLVLDDLGAVVPTGWVWDAVSIILNTRYNDKRTTIITTNFEDGPAKGTLVLNGQSAAKKQATIAARIETLGDRIGERMRSRLFEMCRVVHVDGKDYRQKFRNSGTRQESL